MVGGLPSDHIFPSGAPLDGAAYWRRLGDRWLRTNQDSVEYLAQVVMLNSSGIFVIVIDGTVIAQRAA